jgi:F-type H+-transporting ATPase subunit b
MASHSESSHSESSHAEHGHMTGTEVPGHEGSSAFPPFDAANFAPLLVWLALSFGLLYLLMAKIALPRVEDILQKRSAKINGDLGEAYAMREKADQASAAYEKTLTDAKTKAQLLAQETHAKLAGETESKRQTLEAALNAKLQAAEVEIEAMKAKAMGNVETIAQDAAAAIVERITGKSVDPKVIAAAMTQTKA